MRINLFTTWGLGICLVLLFGSLAEAQPVSLDEPWKIFHRFTYTDCIDKDLGYKIKCSPLWPLDTKPTGMILLINDEPGRIVTLTISLHDERGLSMDDLSPQALKRVFRYADNFVVGRATVGGVRAVMIEAALRDYPQVKVLDYFLIKDGRMFRLSFSANTGDVLPLYKPLFKKLASSFRFVEVVLNKKKPSSLNSF